MLIGKNKFRAVKEGFWYNPITIADLFFAFPVHYPK
jgi:hypothetical protein